MLSPWTPAHNAYVTGYTRPATSRPHPERCNNAYAGGSRDAFVAKINPGGTALRYGTLLGGGDDDVGSASPSTARVNAYMTGKTSSEQLPRLAWRAGRRQYAGGAHELS